jgi:hypothetical protein
MKKIAFLFVVGIFSLGIASAQNVNFGLKGGLTFSTLNFDDVTNIVSNASSYDLESDEAFMGYHFGAFARIEVFSLYIQPELYFTTSGGKVLVEETPDAGSVVRSVREIKYNKIDLPVLVGFKIGPVRANAGPVATVLLSEDNGVEDIIPELEALSKTATVGLQAGVGVDLFKFLTIDYRFEGSLSKYGDKFTIGGADYAFDSRANIHLISLGIMF